MTEACIRVDLGTSGIGTITVSNPAKYNAMTMRMWLALAAAVRELQDDDTVRVVVVRGEGEKSFVSGADISEFGAQRQGQTAVAQYDQAVSMAQEALATCSKPTVARIQGVCMGGGIGIAAACDLRLASSDTRFRMPAARIGLGYGLDGMQRLVQILGAPRCFDLFYTARTFDAAEACRIGLVNESFDAADYATQADGRIGLIAANAPLSIRAAKMAILASLGVPSQEECDAIDAMVRRCFDSHDYIEGQAAFAQRRAPVFNGR